MDETIATLDAIIDYEVEFYAMEAEFYSAAQLSATANLRHAFERFESAGNLLLNLLAIREMMLGWIEEHDIADPALVGPDGGHGTDVSEEHNPAAPGNTEEPNIAAPEEAEEPNTAAPEEAEKPNTAAPEEAEEPNTAPPEEAEEPNTAAPEETEEPNRAAPGEMVEYNTAASEVSEEDN